MDNQLPIEKELSIALGEILFGKRDYFVCPICGIRTNEFPALSRKDNETEICSDCGTNEALDDYFRRTSPEASN